MKFWITHDNCDWCDIFTKAPPANRYDMEHHVFHGNNRVEGFRPSKYRRYKKYIPARKQFARFEFVEGEKGTTVADGTLTTLNDELICEPVFYALFGRFAEERRFRLELISDYYTFE